MDIHLIDLSWPEIEAVLKQRHLLILPVGSTEQHGHHLPIDVDARCATYFAEQLAERLNNAHKIRALVAPTIPFTDSINWLAFPGTMAISSETVARIIEEVVSGLVRQGFKNILVLNGHHPNMTPIAMGLRRSEHESSNVGLYAINWWTAGYEKIPGIRKSSSGLHADEVETSVYMAIRPDKVHMEKAVTDMPRFSLSSRWVEPDLVGVQRVYYHSRRKYPVKGKSSGVMGDPSASSAETGKKIINAVLEGLVDISTQIVDSAGPV